MHTIKVNLGLPSEHILKAHITVMMRDEVLDPRGHATALALHSLGFNNVEDVRQGKVIEVRLKAMDEASTKGELDAMCRQLLANPVIEVYSIEIERSEGE